jgi:hypothetical protein
MRVGAVLGAGKTVFISPRRSAVSTSMDRSASSWALAVFPNRCSLAFNSVSRTDGPHRVYERRTRARPAHHASRPAPHARTPRSSGQSTPHRDGTRARSHFLCRSLLVGCNTHARSAAARRLQTRTRSNPRPRSARTRALPRRAGVGSSQAWFTERRQSSRRWFGER